MVIQRLHGGDLEALCEMKNCGPLPEPIASVAMRSVLQALQEISGKGYLPTQLLASHVWLCTDDIRLGAIYAYDWQPASDVSWTRGVLL